MYKIPKYVKTTLVVNESTEGETLEMKIDRFINNREPIADIGSNAIYMERKEGVNAAYNIKTDRFDVALKAMDKVSRSIEARRDEKAKMEIVKGNEESSEVG